MDKFKQRVEDGVTIRNGGTPSNVTIQRAKDLVASNPEVEPGEIVMHHINNNPPTYRVEVEREIPGGKSSSTIGVVSSSTTK